MGLVVEFVRPITKNPVRVQFAADAKYENGTDISFVKVLSPTVKT